MKDLTGYFFNHYSRLIQLLIVRKLCYWPTFLKLILKGVKIGHGCKFWGKLYVHRAPGSTLKIGENCTFRSYAQSNLIGINRPCLISCQYSTSRILIGNNCGFSGSAVWAFDSITIGNNVRIGANCTIVDGDAHQDDPRVGISKPVIIEDNVWLGLNVIVLKGVTIGRNSLIGAGSVVTKSIPPNVVAAGNPCRIIKEID